MPKLIMCKGLPGAGKSTWAKAEVLKYPTNSYKRVNKDDLRAMIDCGRYSRGAERVVLAARNAIIEEALFMGCNVIVDDTNLNPVHEEKLREIAHAFGAEFIIKRFDADRDTCLERNAKRESPIPAQVIHDMWYRYIRGEEAT